MKKTLLGIIMFMPILIFAQKNKETMVLLETTQGNIKIKLYNETPKHRDNFIKLVTEKYYDGLLFHRVIKDFMIQTGDPNSKNAPKGKALGSGGPGYTIPAEFNPAFIHKKGALAAARTGDNINPLKASSGSQFYIVGGRKISDDELNQIEDKISSSQKIQLMKDYLSKPENKSIKDEYIKYQNENMVIKMDSIRKIIDKTISEKYKNNLIFKYTPQQREIYRTIGGTPFLDMNYTVFGEVIEGLDIVDKIASVKVDTGNRPEEDVKIISVKILK